VIPDFTTVWLFRERLIDNEVQQWSELNKQMERRGLKVRKGVIQDATFITADELKRSP